MSEIFTPTERDMRIEYPEILDIPEFFSLTNEDLKFVWNYACKSSPFIFMGDNERMEVSLINGYGKDYFKNKKALSCKSGDIPDDIVVAINRMKSFIPAVRTKANKMMLDIFKNLEKISKITENEYEAMDFAEKKSYVQLATSISESLPSIIHQIEVGFSVKKKDNKNSLDDDDSNLMDSVIDESSF